jgi:4-hydroxy-tetrahydrodipicolinate synthase
MNLNDYPLWTAIVTPLLESGEVDYESFKNILQEQADAKNALVVLGSTGESLNLNLKVKKEIVEFSCAQNLSVPILSGGGGHLLEECLEWLELCNNKSIHAFLLVTPHYAKPGHQGQTHWFKSLMDKSNHPVMLYNVPSRSGTSLHYDAVKDLSSHKNFWAIKEASGKIEDFRKYIQAAPNARM